MELVVGVPAVDRGPKVRRVVERDEAHNCALMHGGPRARDKQNGYRIRQRQLGTRQNGYGCTYTYARAHDLAVVVMAMVVVVIAVVVMYPTWR